MKICIISNLYPPNMRGGAERLAAIMAGGLAKSGHEVIVISTKPQSGLTFEADNNIKIYRFRPLNLFYYLDDHKHNVIIRLIWRIIDTFNFHSKIVVSTILHKEKPDLVITHNLVGLGLLVPLVIKAQKIKHIHFIHDVQLAIPSGLLTVGQEGSFLSAGFPTRIYQSLCRLFFENVSLVISPSDWLLNFYKAHGFFKKATTLLLRNPISPSASIVESKQTKHAAYLFIGQIEMHKGIIWLIEFWKKNQIKDKLFIVGEGTLNLANIVTENIIYLGKKEGEELNAIFEAVDFLILPSLCYENSPMVIPQSFQNATPVICADIGGAAELIDEATGFKFAPNSEEDLLAKLGLAKLITAEKYQSMSATCLAKATTLSLDRYIEQLEAMIQSSS